MWQQPLLVYFVCTVCCYGQGVRAARLTAVVPTRNIDVYFAL